MYSFCEPFFHFYTEYHSARELACLKLIQKKKKKSHAMKTHRCCQEIPSLFIPLALFTV